MMSPPPLLEGVASGPFPGNHQNDSIDAGRDGDKGMPGGGASGELELMYDPQLNCFYDPVTCKYYELIQP